jgi:hypothetical protein
MAFATEKIYIATRELLSSVVEASSSRIPIGLDQGGHGVQVVGITDLQKAQSVMQSWALLGMDLLILPNILPLVPEGKLPSFIGATDLLGGTRGLPPSPAAGDQNRAFVGGGGYSTTIECVNLNASHVPGETTLKLVATGDGENGWTINNRGSWTYDARLQARSDVDASTHARVDGVGSGRLVDKGDPVVTSIHFPCLLIPERRSTNLSRMGFTAPVEVGTQSHFQSARGNCKTYQYVGVLASEAGIWIPDVTQRRWDFDLIVEVESSRYLQSRLHVGLFSNDPSQFWQPHTDPTPNTTLTGVFSCDGAAEQILRNDGLSFITDGWVVGDVCHAAGFALGSNPGRHYVTAVAAGALTVSTNLTTEASPVGAVTLRRTIIGAGIRYDYLLDGPPNSGAGGSNHFRTWSSGGLLNATQKACNTTANGLTELQPAVDTVTRFRIVHVPQSAGLIEFWVQLQSDDSSSSNVGRWYLLQTHDANVGEFVPSGTDWLGLAIKLTKLDNTATQGILRFQSARTR